MAEEKGVWRTIRGRRVFIREGEDLYTAMKNSGKFENLGRTEYQKAKAEYKKNEFKKQQTDLWNAYGTNRYKFGDKYWKGKIKDNISRIKEEEERLDLYDNNQEYTNASKMIDYNAKTRAERYRNYNTETPEELKTNTGYKVVYNNDMKEYMTEHTNDQGKKWYSSLGNDEYITDHNKKVEKSSYSYKDSIDTIKREQAVENVKKGFKYIDDEIARDYVKKLEEMKSVQKYNEEYKKLSDKYDAEEISHKEYNEKMDELKRKYLNISQEEEYELYKKAKINPDSIDPMTENSTDWEALDRKYASRYNDEIRKQVAINTAKKFGAKEVKVGEEIINLENKPSYTKSGKLNYKQFGIVSTPEASFSDDGTRFSAYRLPNGMEMTVAKDDNDIYLSVRNPYHKEVSYEEYSSLPHYKDLDMYNGVRKNSVDLNKVIESSNAYMEEYNALLRKKGISVDTRSINERRLDDINSQIEMAKASYKYHNENQDYTRWRYHRNEARKAYNKEIKLTNQKEKLIAEIEGFKRRKK